MADPWEVVAPERSRPRWLLDLFLLVALLLLHARLVTRVVRGLDLGAVVWVAVLVAAMTAGGNFSGGGKGTALRCTRTRLGGFLPLIPVLPLLRWVMVSCRHLHLFPRVRPPSSV